MPLAPRTVAARGSRLGCNPALRLKPYRTARRLQLARGRDREQRRAKPTVAFLFHRCKKTTFGQQN
eukprot:398544-Prymnesium_polylepis.1